MKKLEKYINRFIFRIFYGIKFDKNYEYTGWTTSFESDILFQTLHESKISDGWEDVSDIIFYFGKATMIYKRPKSFITIN